MIVAGMASAQADSISGSSRGPLGGDRSECRALEGFHASEMLRSVAPVSTKPARARGVPCASLIEADATLRQNDSRIEGDILIG